MARNKSNWAANQWLRKRSKDREGWTEQRYSDGYAFHMIAPNGKIVEIKLSDCRYVIDFDGDRIGRPSGYTHCSEAMIAAENLVCK